VAAWAAWITEKHLKTTGHREEGSGNCSGPSPGRAQRRLALAVVVAFFITAGPLSTIQLGRIDAFIPAYATAMFVNDSITRSCNEKRIADYPNLSNYMRELYQVPGVAATVKPRYYVINYYSIAKLNPTGIIPKGTPVDLGQPHDRARLAA
jgi:hypothetical protein